MTAGEPRVGGAGGMRVSVVMPVYNAADTVAQSMQSVLAQTYPDLELVIVDDGSADDSPAVIDAVGGHDPRVVVLRNPGNRGVAASRNTGIEAASGDYIAFLDSDDWWHPRKLEVQLAQMRAAGARVSYAGYQRVDEAGHPLSTVRPPATVGYADMLKSNRIGNLTGLYDRSLGDGRFQRVGHEDYVFWLQMVRRAGIAVCARYPEPLAFYRVRAGSLSSDKLKAARWQWHIYREMENLSRTDACRYFLHYGVNALVKRH